MQEMLSVIVVGRIFNRGDDFITGQKRKEIN
jgi:hypothetical protein